MCCAKLHTNSFVDYSQQSSFHAFTQDGKNVLFCSWLFLNKILIIWFLNNTVFIMKLTIVFSYLHIYMEKLQLYSYSWVSIFFPCVWTRKETLCIIFVQKYLFTHYHICCKILHSMLWLSNVNKISSIFGFMQTKIVKLGYLLGTIRDDDHSTLTSEKYLNMDHNNRDEANQNTVMFW